MSADLRALVFEALGNATANGYWLEATVRHADAIIEDLLDCDADLEARTPDELRPHVVAWLEERAR